MQIEKEIHNYLDANDIKLILANYFRIKIVIPYYVREVLCIS